MAFLKVALVSFAFLRFTNLISVLVKSATSKILLDRLDLFNFAYQNKALDKFDGFRF
jgi:hypothetical protein